LVRKPRKKPASEELKFPKFAKVTKRNVKKESCDQDESEDESSEDVNPAAKKAAAPAKKATCFDDDEEEEDPAGGDDKNKKELFVSNLSFATTDHSIRGAFGKFGKITNIKLPQGPDGRPKGFAFVEFATQADAKKAWDSMNGQDLGGRGLIIKFCSGFLNGRGNEAGRLASAVGPPSSFFSEADTVFVGNLGFKTQE
jgi:RNA recognition motif-containing protein